MPIPVPAPVPNADQRLFMELNELSDIVAGPGMSTTISGAQLRGALDLLKRLIAEREEQAKLLAPTLQAAEQWTSALAGVVPILADIVESGDYCGVPIQDALAQWAATNQTEIEPEAMTAINRSLSGGS